MVQDLFAAPGAARSSDIFAFAADVEADQRMEIARMGSDAEGATAMTCSTVRGACVAAAFGGLVLSAQAQEPRTSPAGERIRGSG